MGWFCPCRDAIDRAVSLLPETYALLLHQLHDNGVFKLCSAASLQRHQLTLDVCLCMYRRMYLSAQTGSRYLFADSSPQGHRDWLIVKYRFWPDKDMNHHHETSSRIIITNHHHESSSRIRLLVARAAFVENSIKGSEIDGQAEPSQL